MDVKASRRRRSNPSAQAYFAREGLEFCFVIGGLAIADWITQVPLWVWVTLPIGKVLSSVLFYVLFLHRSLRQRPRQKMASWVGRSARTLAPLNPDGQIKIDGEIWLARSLNGHVIPAHHEVLIREVRGRLLFVEAQTVRDKPVLSD